MLNVVQCRILLIVVVNVIVLCGVMLNVIMLSGIVVNVDMLSGVMLSVTAPSLQLFSIKDEKNWKLVENLRVNKQTFFLSEIFW